MLTAESPSLTLRGTIRLGFEGVTPLRPILSTLCGLMLLDL
jgi:hypothetical protein